VLILISALRIKENRDRTNAQRKARFAGRAFGGAWREAAKRFKRNTE
jgi:hypothetical protein